MLCSDCSGVFCFTGEISVVLCNCNLGNEQVLQQAEEDAATHFLHCFVNCQSLSSVSDVDK